MPKILEQWQIFVDAQGMTHETACARLGAEWYDYHLWMKGQRDCPESVLYRMEKIMQGRTLIETSILRTALYNDFEKLIKAAQMEKQMIVGAAPTGAGKTTVAKHLAFKHECKYIKITADMQKKKVASMKNFVRDLMRLHGMRDRGINNLRHLIDALNTDGRMILIIDESQRLITEDWGYFKVLQDIFDDVPSLSIILIGSYKFYDEMFVSPEQTYSGTNDQEQYLRRMTKMIKFPRLQASDVKLWADYHSIKLTTREANNVAEFFSVRAGLSDLENVRKEIVSLMGRGKIKSFDDVDGQTLVLVYKALHTKFTEELSYGKFAQEEARKSA